MSWLLVALVGGALACAQMFFGGVHMVHAQIAYACLGVAGAISAILWGRRRTTPDAACVAATLAFLGYVALRAALSPVAHLGREDWMLALGCLLVYWITAFYLGEPRQRLVIVALLLALVAAHLWVGLIQFTRDGTFLPWGEVRVAGYKNRASGMFVCPNHLAGALEVVALFGLSIVFWGRWPFWAKILVCYATLMAYCGVLLSGSRGGYLSSAVGLAVFCGLSLAVVWRAMPELFTRRMLLLLLFVGLIGGGGAVLVARSELLRDRASKLVETDVRPTLWKAGLRQFQMSPLLGTGARSYVYLGRKLRDPSLQLDPVFAHSDYVQLLAEYGILGICLALAFVAAHLRRGLRSVWWAVANRLPYVKGLQSDALALTLGALASVSAYLAHSIVDFNLHIPANALLLAFAGGILANPGWVQGDPSRPGARWATVCRAALPALGALMLVPVASQWMGRWHYATALREFDARRYTPAINTLKAALKHEPRNPEIHFLMGLSRMRLARRLGDEYLRTSMVEAAASAFRQGAAIYPQDVRIWLKLGQALDQLGRHDQAWEAFSRALELDPKLYRVLERVGYHFQVRGMYPEARKYYEEARRLRGSAVSLAGLQDIEALERRGGGEN